MSSHALLTASCLSQRLVAAVEEVMELVRATVIQYEQESTQVRRENQLLRSKLVQITGGLPPETAGESSPTGDEWADWTRHMDQNSGTTADLENQQNQDCKDPDLAYEDQNLTQGCAALAGPCESAAACESHGQNLSPEPGLVPLGPPTKPPTEPPTSCIGVKTEWTDHAPEPSDQSEQNGSTDVKTEHRLPTRTIKTEPQDTELFSELHLVAEESTHAHPGLDLESVAMETVTFVERHLELRESGSGSGSGSDASAVAPPPVPSPTTNTSHHHSQPITAQLPLPHDTDTRPPQLSAHPPHVAVLSLCSSQLPAGGAAAFTHNPSARPRPLLTAQGRDPGHLPQRHHGNPVATSSPAVGRGRARGRCTVSFPCQQCGKLFVHRSRLRVHMLIHTGEKPYACQRCGKRFNNDGTLKNHQRVHTQLRLYSCPLCAMRFKDAYTCRKHLATHTRRAQAQGNTQDTHTRTPQTQGSMLNTHNTLTHTRHPQALASTHNAHNTHPTLRAPAQVNMLSSHNAQNTHRTHNTHSTNRGQGLPVSHVRAHTHAVTPQTHTHTHTHTPSSTLWMGRSTDTEGRGQR